MPLRDDRRGKRATIGGDAPLRTSFPAAVPSAVCVRFAPEIEEPRDALALVAIAHANREAEPGASLSPSSDTPLVATSDLPEATERIDRTERPGFDVRAIAAAFGFRRVSGSLPVHAASESVDEPAAAHDLSFADEVVRLTAIPVPAPLSFPNASETNTNEKENENERRTSPEAVAVSGNAPATFERARPPLTRLPLRPRRDDVTWIRARPGGDAWTEAERHAELRRFTSMPGDVAELLDTLCLAFREETPAGRALALRALARHDRAATRAIFLDALRRGDDEERAYAVAIFDERGDRDALVEALSDRVDAIAARAALACFEGSSRSEMATALMQHVDRSRVDAILALLAGVLA